MISQPLLNAADKVLARLIDDLRQGDNNRIRIEVTDEESDSLYSVYPDHVLLHLHPGQMQTWQAQKRFVFMLAGTQGGKTSFGPWWLAREIEEQGAGDYIAATATYDMFKLKMLPEMRNVFERILNIARYWPGDKIMELRDPETGEFWASRAGDPMYARIILRAASSEGGLESTTGKAAWLDEVGQNEFGLGAWEAILRRLSLSQGRVLGTTTLYNLGWLKQQIYDQWKKQDDEIDVIQFQSVINPLFPQAEFNRAKKRLPAWKFKMQYRGEYDKPAGMIYNDFIDLYKHEGGHKVTPFDIPEWWPRYVGVDPGANNTAKVWLAKDPDKNEFYAYRESLEGNMSNREHAQRAQQLAKGQREKVIWYAVGQKSEKQVRLDWWDAGVTNVKSPPFADVEAGIDKVIELLRTFTLYVFDDMDNLLDEFGTYARKLDKNGDPTEVIENKNIFHHLDALRYFTVQISMMSGMVLKPAHESLANYRG